MLDGNGATAGSHAHEKLVPRANTNQRAFPEAQRFRLLTQLMINRGMPEEDEFLFSLLEGRLTP